MLMSGTRTVLFTQLQVYNSVIFNECIKCTTNYLFIYLFAISWAAPVAYGGSQARGRIGAVATGLRQSHSNAGSEPHLQPTPQLTATPDRQPTQQGQGPNPQPHGS